MTGYQSSSQESLLLSDESCAFLYNQLGLPLNDVDNVSKPANQEYPVVEQVSNFYTVPLINQPLTNSENLLTNIPQEQKNVPSSLPATESWPGEFHFNVEFRFDEAGKKSDCIYVEARNKLYVRRDAACAIDFSTNAPMTEGVTIRVMALFSCAEHALQIVHRCVNHSMPEIANNLREAEHLVRCESRHAFYECDQNTQRHSVVVPFENPPAGQQSSCYIYKFKCFGSCAGGPNRRPLMLVFTLEKGGSVIGRQKVDLKVCACPSRDMKADEIQLNPDFAKSKPEKRVNHNVTDTVSSKRTKFETIGLTPDTIGSVPNNHRVVKKVKKMNPKKGKYVIQTDDKNCFECLYALKLVYYLTENKEELRRCQNIPVDLWLSFSSSEDDCKDENKEEN